MRYNSFHQEITITLRYNSFRQEITITLEVFCGGRLEKEGGVRRWRRGSCKWLLSKINLVEMVGACVYEGIQDIKVEGKWVDIKGSSGGYTWLINA